MKDKDNSYNNSEYCGECIHLNVTEKEQTNMRIKPNHYCNKFKKVVLHREYHPNLPKLEACINFKKRKAKK
jgi:ribosomal protein L33